jgi:hypothetical protein
MEKIANQEGLNLADIIRRACREYVVRQAATTDTAKHKSNSETNLHT